MPREAASSQSACWPGLFCDHNEQPLLSHASQTVLVMAKTRNNARLYRDATQLSTRRDSVATRAVLASTLRAGCQPAANTGHHQWSLEGDSSTGQDPACLLNLILVAVPQSLLNYPSHSRPVHLHPELQECTAPRSTASPGPAAIRPSGSQHRGGSALPHLNLKAEERNVGGASTANSPLGGEALLSENGTRSRVERRETVPGSAMGPRVQLYGEAGTLGLSG